MLAVARRARVGGHDAVEGVVPHAHALQPQPDHVPLHTCIDGRRNSVSEHACAARLPMHAGVRSAASAALKAVVEQTATRRRLPARRTCVPGHA